ncbi:MAG TPA: hypothetical protein VGM20_04240 [Gemmatimonadales bacterium]
MTAPPAAHGAVVGNYRAIYSFTIPAAPFPDLHETDTVSIAVQTVSDDSITGTASGSHVTTGSFSLGFWNVDAFLVYVQLNYTPMLELRMQFSPTACGATTGVLYPDFRHYYMDSCSLTKQ